mmetsp:Transcript_17783/g.47040  ORF Transcript_17783/g.47040 Transcript_17783/m.47040 type:complete len:294 (-) Transcript_17783:1150-2031(-)
MSFHSRAFFVHSALRSPSAATAEASCDLRCLGASPRRRSTQADPEARCCTSRLICCCTPCGCAAPTTLSVGATGGESSPHERRPNSEWPETPSAAASAACWESALSSSISCHARSNMSVTSGASVRARKPLSMSATSPASSRQAWAVWALVDFEANAMVLEEAARAVVSPLVNSTPGVTDTTLWPRPAEATVVRMACLRTLSWTSCCGTTTRHLWPDTPDLSARALQTPEDVPTTTVLVAASTPSERLVSVSTAMSVSPWSTAMTRIESLSFRLAMSATILCSVRTCWCHSSS